MSGDSRERERGWMSNGEPATAQETFSKTLRETHGPRRAGLGILNRRKRRERRASAKRETMNGRESDANQPPCSSCELPDPIVQNAAFSHEVTGDCLGTTFCSLGYYACQQRPSHFPGPPGFRGFRGQRTRRLPAAERLPRLPRVGRPATYFTDGRRNLEARSSIRAIRVIL
jgi:hypothetical protein